MFIEEDSKACFIFYKDSYFVTIEYDIGLLLALCSRGS